VHVVDLVDFDQILEKHEDYVREKAGSFAESGIVKHIKNKRAQCLEVLVILQNLTVRQIADIFRN
jgi:hypothetical protein